MFRSNIPRGRVFSHCVRRNANTNPICVADLSIYGENGGKCAATIHTRIKVKCHFGLPRSSRNGKSVQRLVRARAASLEGDSSTFCLPFDGFEVANDMKSDDFEIIAVERRSPLFQWVCPPRRDWRRTDSDCRAFFHADFVNWRHLDRFEHAKNTVSPALPMPSQRLSTALFT